MRAALALIVAFALPCVAQDPRSATVLGPSNVLLAEGAAALEAGRIQEGIDKTLEGLRGPSTREDEAAGHSNLCGGYGALKRFDDALEHCNAALAIDPQNWRTYNNRAAAYTGKGLYDLALADLATGLEIAPNSQTLKKSLRIVHEHKRAHKERSRSLIES